jgi:hypothetical protein
MTDYLTTKEGVVKELDGIPAGAGCAGRTETEKEPAAMQEKKTYPRHRTVKGKKRRKGHRHKKNPGGRAMTGKRDGQHVPRSMYEAMAILRAEGYIVGKILDPESAFDITGWSYRGSILVTVVRPKEPVANAHDVTELYGTKVRKMQPYCRSDADNIQFWVFSREIGLIRYRVFDWGIGNEEKMLKSMQKQHAAQSDKKIAPSEPANRRARNSPCPDEPTGNAGAPVDTPLHAAITSYVLY